MPPITIALDVPPLARCARPTRGAPDTRPDRLRAEGATALAERARAAWAAVGCPAPLVEIEKFSYHREPSSLGSGSHLLHLPRVRALGGVPAGYAGRVRVL